MISGFGQFYNPDGEWYFGHTLLHSWPYKNVVFNSGTCYGISRGTLRRVHPLFETEEFLNDPQRKKSWELTYHRKSEICRYFSFSFWTNLKVKIIVFTDRETKKIRRWRFASVHWGSIRPIHWITSIERDLWHFDHRITRIFRERERGFGGINILKSGHRIGVAVRIRFRFIISRKWHMNSFRKWIKNIISKREWTGRYLKCRWIGIMAPFCSMRIRHRDMMSGSIYGLRQKDNGFIRDRGKGEHVMTVHDLKLNDLYWSSVKIDTKNMK